MLIFGNQDPSLPFSIHLFLFLMNIESLLNLAYLTSSLIVILLTKQSKCKEFWARKEKKMISSLGSFMNQLRSYVAQNENSIVDWAPLPDDEILKFYNIRPSYSNTVVFSCMMVNDQQKVKIYYKIMLIKLYLCCILGMPIFHDCDRFRDQLQITRVSSLVSSSILSSDFCEKFFL